ncbi:C-type mannose receptor 2-like isoform X2 [Acanthaster planci]|uniref:C-type mannose receptor 2-like isoform X2 n=1 Tax=Acanthaster planci TaxID=133434 RepID=A0A8B7YK65_ACAPL|nr:C-type mannose receptor 2-like isoform X2 [Acanthaster planci]
MPGLSSRIFLAHLVSCILKVYCQSDKSHPQICSDGVQFQGRCYWFSTEPANWLDANHKCSQYGGNVRLPVITNQEQEDWLHATLPYHDMWIGLHDIHADGQWSWVDGTYPNYTNWGYTHPWNSSNHNCAIVSHLGGVWVDTQCHSEHHYACSSTPNHPICHSGGIFFRDRCYWKVNGTRLSMSGAEAACEEIERGAQLVVIHDGELNTFLSKLANPLVWIGLTDSEHEGFFKWIDGSSITFRNWRPREPNDSNNNEDCATLDYGTGSWNDVECSRTQDGFSVVCALPSCRDEGSGDSGPCLDSSEQCSCVSGGYCSDVGRCRCLRRFHGMVCDTADVRVRLHSTSDVMEGGLIELTCHVNIPKSDYSLQIQHLIAHSSHRPLPEDRTRFYLDNEENGYHRVVISNATINDTGNYVCVVSTSAGIEPLTRVDSTHVKVKSKISPASELRSNQESYLESGLTVAVGVLAACCILLIILLVVVKVLAKMRKKQDGPDVSMNALLS